MNGSHQDFTSPGAEGTVYVKNNIVKNIIHTYPGTAAYGGFFNESSGYNLTDDIPNTYIAQ